MNKSMIFGIILIIFGIFTLAYQGFSYTSKEKIVDMGPLQISADTNKTIPLPPILGGLALAGGIVLVIVGRKKA